jgi:sulfur-carrier protein
MIVKVKLFAVAKDLAGRDVLSIELPPGATIAELRQRIASQHPALNNVLSHALWAVDAHYAEDATPLNELSNVALIPPVSGG